MWGSGSQWSIFWIRTELFSATVPESVASPAVFIGIPTIFPKVRFELVTPPAEALFCAFRIVLVFRNIRTIISAGTLSHLSKSVKAPSSKASLGPATAPAETLLCTTEIAFLAVICTCVPYSSVLMCSFIPCTPHYVTSVPLLYLLRYVGVSDAAVMLSCGPLPSARLIFFIFPNFV